jgi:hydrogenase maturation protein HypF
MARELVDTVATERIEVEGTVQGVGFRPFVHRLATELGLRGHVGNDSSMVFIELEGDRATISTFVDRLRDEAPPLATIDRVTRSPSQAERPPSRHFRIVDSRSVDGPRTLIPPDTALCADCRRELFDPADRRYRHPFITCTNCGPRFTIITSLPYDRPNTTMAGFPLCPQCQAEYRDPADRRYHAQPIGCHQCGPTLRFRRPAPDPGHAPDPALSQNPIEAAVAALAQGRIVAIKGLGGYHLACDATNGEAVAELRARKHRADKPFAVMVADIDHAAELAEIDEASAALLTSPAAPVVLVPAWAQSPISALVAPGNPLVGLMLAYTPIHHLVLSSGRTPLVMTSANRGGEPIAWNHQRLDGLADLYDAVLDHDRPIHQPCDDSVVRALGERLLPIRRARGYAPIPVSLGRGRGAVLAVGGELKNTFCLAADGHAWVSQHLGDMENLETLRSFESSVDAFTTMYAVAPELVAADPHPGYLTSRWAEKHHPTRVVRVQHHHAHVAAVGAEHGLDPATPVIGFAFDGTGYGDDGTIWGGEVLVGPITGLRRAFHLAPIPLPGGDAAIRNPARVALAHLHAAGLDWGDDLAPVTALGRDTVDLLRRQLDRGTACVATTSMGRLFDAIASLIGLRHEISYEAQAAIELEIAAERGRSIEGPDQGHRRYRLARQGPSIVVGPVLEAVVADLRAGAPAPVIARRFHQAVVEVVVEIAVEERARSAIDRVALSGGVFQNALLTRLCTDRLAAEGFTVMTHQLVPPNDGGLALGQAFIASHRQLLEET